MEAGATTAAGGSSGAVTMAPEGATVLSLPEGSSMMIGEDGEQYVTIQQDGQTYAIPLSEYQSMQPGGTITIQVSFDVKTKCHFLISSVSVKWKCYDLTSYFSNVRLNKSLRI